jgi:hypothetical protein
MDRDEVASALKNVKLEGFVWPEPDDADDVRLIKNVIAHGCHIIGVEKEIGYPEFAYSIGLYLNYLQPEIVIVELDHTVAGRVINRIAKHFKNGGTLTCGMPYSGFYDASPLMFRELRMTEHTEELGFAIWFYCSRSGGLTFPVFQAIWPDKTGRFPSDPACEPSVARTQMLRRK